MPALDPIDDSNTYATKTEGGNPGDTNDVVSAADLNALKTVVGENRDQANAALAAYAGESVEITASLTLAATDHGKLYVLAAAAPTVITVPAALFGSVYTDGVFRVSFLVTDADAGVTLAGSGGLSLAYFGRNHVQNGDFIEVTVPVTGTAGLVRITPLGDALLAYDGGTVTAATRTLTVADATQIIGLDPTSNAIAVTIPHTLFWAGGTGRTFQCTLVALNVTNAITLAGSGGLGLTYYGSSTITAGDIIRVSVESATVCRVEVVKTGDAAGTHIANTSNPHSVTAAQVGADPKTTVQTAHTTSTLTLADADHNQHRALNTASNSIAISIPNTLAFPFVWTARKSSASNSVTITTGAGLITPKASGTVPVTAVDAYITVFAESSTVAAVFVTVAT